MLDYKPKKKRKGRERASSLKKQLGVLFTDMKKVENKYKLRIYRKLSISQVISLRDYKSKATILSEGEIYLKCNIKWRANSN